VDSGRLTDAALPRCHGAARPGASVHGRTTRGELASRQNRRGTRRWTKGDRHVGRSLAGACSAVPAEAALGAGCRRVVGGLLRRLRRAWARRRDRSTRPAAAWTKTIDSEDLLRTVIDESPDIILMKDWDGRFLLGNRALARLYGTTPDQLVGHRRRRLQPERRAGGLLPRERAQRACGARRPRSSWRARRTSRPVRCRHFQSIKKPLRRPGRRRRILVIAHDVTDLQRANEEIQRARAQLLLRDGGRGRRHLGLGHHQQHRHAQRQVGRALRRRVRANCSTRSKAFTELLHPDDRAAVEARARRRPRAAAATTSTSTGWSAATASIIARVRTAVASWSGHERRHAHAHGRAPSATSPIVSTPSTACA